MGNTPDHQPVDAFQGPIDTHQAEIARLKAERSELRELPISQRLRLGTLAYRVSLYVRTGREEDVVAEYERQRSQAGGY